MLFVAPRYQLAPCCFTKHMVFLYSPLFVVRLVFFFSDVKVGISSKDAVNSMRSELLDLPDCWGGELKRFEDFSRDMSPIFFSPSSGLLGCG